MDALLGEILGTLPNFPHDVAEDWILPYAKTEGWPPTQGDQEIPTNRWRYLLKLQSLAYWRAVAWSFEERHVSIDQLSPGSKDAIIQMVLGATQGEANLYSRSIPNLRERMTTVLEYIRDNGTLPKPPILEDTNDGIEIVDGNHRMATYFYSYGYFKLEVPDEFAYKAKELQRYWIATPPPEG